MPSGKIVLRPADSIIKLPVISLELSSTAVQLTAHQASMFNALWLLGPADGAARRACAADT